MELLLNVPVSVQVGGAVITLLVKTRKVSYEDESVKEENYKETTQLAAGELTKAEAKSNNLSLKLID